MLSAQNATIKGVIKNETTDLPMARISLSLNGATTFSNNEGFFVFYNVTQSKHKLLATCLGFETIETEINVTSNNQLIELNQLKMKTSAIQIGEVIISATPNNFSHKYEGSNVIISTKEIEQVKPVGTEEMLKKVSGINIAGDMGISNRLNVGIRGSYPRRSVNILLLEDGTPIAPAPYLAPEAYYNPPSDRLDGIEVIKGADILAYGSNTMYGAINYITKKPPLKPTAGINVVKGSNGYNSKYLTYGGTWNTIGAEIQVLDKQFHIQKLFPCNMLFGLSFY